MPSSSSLLVLFATLLPALFAQTTVVDVVAGHANLTTLTLALGAFQLTTADVLANPAGTFTVFAPTDAAFETALATLGLTPEQLLADPSTLTTLLSHVLGIEVDAAAAIAAAGSKVPTLGEYRFITPLVSQVESTTIVEIDTGAATGQVIEADLEADNGVVHVVDTVLLPVDLPTITDITIWSGFSIQETALDEADLLLALDQPRQSTLFSASDGAWESLFEELGISQQQFFAPERRALWYQTVLYNLIDGEAYSGDLVDGDVIDTITNATILVNIDDLGNVSFTDAGGRVTDVVSPDIMASNGVVHIVDQVMLPFHSIYDLLSTTGQHDLLKAAVDAAGLNETLSGPGPFTLLAPTDDAVIAATVALGITPEDLLASPDLANILLYHVFGAFFDSAIVFEANGAKLSTLEMYGQELTVNATAGVAVDFITADYQVTSVIAPDIYASNGVIHAVDTVILPLPNIVEVAMTKANLSILVEAINATGLVDTLSEVGSEFTVFAPTNDAFAAVLSELDVTKEELLALEGLSDILLYHVVPMLYDSSAVAAEVGNSLTSAQGGPLMVTAIGLTDERGNNASIVSVDELAANGYIHVIDTVLFPPTSSPTAAPIETDEPTSMPTAAPVSSAFSKLQFTTLVALFIQAIAVASIIA